MDAIAANWKGEMSAWGLAHSVFETPRRGDRRGDYLWGCACVRCPPGVSVSGVGADRGPSCPCPCLPLLLSLSRAHE